MSDQEAKSSPNILGVILLTVFLDLVGFSIIFPLFPDMLEYYLSKEASGGYFHSFIQTLQQFSGLEGQQADLPRRSCLAAYSGRCIRHCSLLRRQFGARCRTASVVGASC